jgi:hypothetical protein
MNDSLIAKGKYRVPYSGGPGPLQSEPKAQPGSIGSHTRAISYELTAPATNPFTGFGPTLDR